MQKPLDLPDDWNIANFSLAMPQFVNNPAYFYRRLQQESPVHKPADFHHWILTRYADCVLALTDKRFGVNYRTPSATPETMPPGFERLAKLGKHMLGSDPPDHTRLRSLVGKAFTLRAVERLRTHIATIAHGLLDTIVPRGETDLMADFAFHLPAIVIAELLGVPSADREQFKVWSHAVIQAMGADATPERQYAGLKAQLDLAYYFDDLLARRRTAPGDDLITALIQAEEQGDQLDEDELVATCFLLLIAGHETTTNLIGSGMLALLEHPDQLALLRGRPDLIRTAVEELLRYTSPVQRMGRVTWEPVEVGGHRIPEGQRVIVVFAAANRDPAIFANPDELDVMRDPNPHLGLGRGIHYCLGAPLARLEAEIAFPILLDRLPSLRLAGEPIWNPATLIRGLQSLPLQF